MKTNIILRLWSSILKLVLNKHIFYLNVGKLFNLTDGVYLS